MTESEGLACTDPTPMLEFLRGKVNERKLRLLTCCCCRGIWHLLTEVWSREAVEMAEQLVDGLATSEEVIHARRNAQEAAGEAVVAEYNAEAKADFCHASRVEVNPRAATELTRR